MPKRIFRETHNAKLMVTTEVDYESDEELVIALANAALRAEIAINSAHMPDGVHVRVHIKGV